MIQSDDNPQNEESEYQTPPTRETVLGEAVILVCEPDSGVRSRIEELLRGAGFAGIMVAEGLAEAAEQCVETPPDVVLLRAPSADGVDDALASSVKALNPDNDISVVLLVDDDTPIVGSALLAQGLDCLSVARELEMLPLRTLVHANLRVVERTLRTRQDSLEEIIEKRTNRLNKALDLLKEAEKRLETELEAAKSETRNRTDYFAETQHELRTPLNAICGMSDAIRAEMFGALDNPKYKEYAENIFKSGQHLLSIIDGRLEMSRIEAGAEPMEVEEVDVSSVIDETAEMLSRIAEKAMVNLNIDVEPDLPIIATDRRKLRQVLVNLVSNAIKFTPENGNVTMSVKKNAKKGVLVLVVSDTGIGMSSTDVRDAMKPYRRMSGDRRSGERGSGLGLTIVRKLVETLGATIQIQSTPGKGTSIAIELPLEAPDGTQPKQAVA
jgi:signal transduction histidine kinase